MAISKRGWGSLRRVKFEEEPVVIRLQTPPCLECGEVSVVELTREEFRALNNKELKIQEALPDRESSFRELVKTGTHDKCWRDMMRALGVEVDDDYS